jgi:hypothetical protein
MYRNSVFWRGNEFSISLDSLFLFIQHPSVTGTVRIRASFDLKFCGEQPFKEVEILSTIANLVGDSGSVLYKLQLLRPMRLLILSHHR